MFLKNFSKRRKRFFTIKSIFLINLFFKKNHYKNNPTTLFSFLINFLKESVNINIPIVFLCIIFFVKVLSFKEITIKKNKITLTTSGVYENPWIKDFSLHKATVFWEKWKQLQRPSTTKTLHNFILDLWEQKYETLQKLKFVRSIEKYYITNVNTKTLANRLVHIDSTPIVPKYSSSSINKYIDLNELNLFEFQYLRKNKVYNKGRYSRCRQNYRTGVYMCMYLSIVSIFGLYYWFYKFSFNFTYLWWLFIGFVGSFFMPKILKYRFYEPKVLLLSFFGFIKWIFFLIKSLFKF